MRKLTRTYEEEVGVAGRSHEDHQWSTLPARRGYGYGPSAELRSRLTRLTADHWYETRHEASFYGINLVKAATGYDYFDNDKFHGRDITIQLP